MRGKTVTVPHVVKFTVLKHVGTVVTVRLNAVR
jgi:hypothetical protein